jgi:hypothetical protein
MLSVANEIAPPSNAGFGKTAFATNQMKEHGSQRNAD